MEAPAEAMPSMSITKNERAEAKRYTEKSTNLTDLSEGGKGARKSDDIMATPMRMTVTPNKKQQRKQEQVAPKELQTAMKKGLEVYSGKGERAPVQSTKEIQSQWSYRGTPSMVTLSRTQMATKADQPGPNWTDLESATAMNGLHQT